MDQNQRVLLFGTCQPSVMVKTGKQANRQKLFLFMDSHTSAFSDLCPVCFLHENKSSLWVVSGHLKVSDGAQA